MKKDCHVVLHYANWQWIIQVDVDVESLDCLVCQPILNLHGDQRGKVWSEIHRNQAGVADQGLDRGQILTQNYRTPQWQMLC